MKNLLLLCSAVFVLAACGSEPSEADIKSALDKAATEQDQMMGQMAGANNPMAAMFKVEFTSVKKIGCKEDGEKAYKCDVEMGIKTAMGEQKSTAPVRLVKGSEGWTATH